MLNVAWLICCYMLHDSVTKVVNLSPWSCANFNWYNMTQAHNNLPPGHLCAQINAKAKWCNWLTGPRAACQHIHQHKRLLVKLNVKYFLHREYSAGKQLASCTNVCNKKHTGHIVISVLCNGKIKLMYKDNLWWHTRLTINELSCWFPFHCSRPTVH